MGKGDEWCFGRLLPQSGRYQLGGPRRAQPHVVCDVFIDRAADIQCNGPMRYYIHTYKKIILFKHKYAHLLNVLMFLIIMIHTHSLTHANTPS
jgi:hypothetical protein